MPFAHIDKQGNVIQTYVKLPSRFQLLEGERLLPYRPPTVDETLFTVLPVVPVALDAMEVLFSVVEKVGGPETKAMKLIARVDADVDSIYAEAVGNRGPEYLEAESQAQGFAAAGYPLTVPSFVQVWANAAGMTPQQAADDILLQANAWRTAVLAIRQQRLQAKAEIRAGNFDNAMLAWHNFVSALRTQLNLTVNS